MQNIQTKHPLPGNRIIVLYVDDEVSNLNSFKAYFRTKYEIYTCLSGKEGLNILNNKDVHIIIADQRMPHMTGVEFIEEAIKKQPEPVRIVVTAHREVDTIVKAFNEGKIFRYHDKPWSFEVLEASIEEAYKLYCDKMKENKL